MSSFAANCSTMAAYGRDRATDLADMGTLTVETPGLGAEIYISTATFGGMINDAYAIGLQGGQLGVFDVSSTTSIFRETPFASSGMADFSEDFRSRSDPTTLYLRDKEFGQYYPGPDYLMGRIGARVCVLLCAHVEINALEFWDFFLGLFTVDLLDDDYNSQLRRILNHSETSVHARGTE